MRILPSGIAALALAAALATIASPSRAQQNANPLPPGEGREIVAVACSQCHYLGTIAKIRDGAAGWRTYVSNMVLRGAQLSPAEVDKVVNYLATNLGPGISLPPQKPVRLPEGSGKQLVETRCALCHDLERVAEVKRTAPIARNRSDLFADLLGGLGPGIVLGPKSLREGSVQH